MATISRTKTTRFRTRKKNRYRRFCNRRLIPTCSAYSYSLWIQAYPVHGCWVLTSFHSDLKCFQDQVPILD